MEAGGGSPPGSGQGSFSADLPVHIDVKVALLRVTQSYTLESQHQGSFHCSSMASSMFFFFFLHSPRGAKAILPSQQGEKNVGQMALSVARVRQLDVLSGAARCLHSLVCRAPGGDCLKQVAVNLRKGSLINYSLLREKT